MGPWDSDKEGQDANMASAPPESCISAEHGCVMFDCLAHLWDWIDPPITQSQFPMENKTTAPATQQPLTQQHLMAHHVHPDQIYQSQHTQIHMATQGNQIQPNGVMHQLLQSQYHSNMTARSPLLENRHELYGTGHNRDYTRHYGANDNYNYIQSPPVQERADIHTDQNVNHDLLHNIPKGYNAEVYQDYLKRNPPKETNQIYQNHQPMYRPNENQYGSKPYLPYSNRIGPQSNTELLRRQYNEIQQMKMQQQLHYQNQAQMHQQQKFAERQLLLQQIHGIQPPPNLQNSIYSDGSYRDIDRYSSKNDFKDYELQKDVEGVAKSKDISESERQMKQYHDTQWQSNPSSDFRETERFRKQEDVKGKSQSPPSDFINQAQKNNVGIISPMKSSESSTPSVKSPSSESRRSSSGNQALRSPIAQRIPSAPVAIAGILYKQGSDGLKVWRKRWFVLSEYCLFYYKSQDEAKLLGSVLLPSYKVSACSVEDKVMRKFAFKLEHANMRTYILAALDQDAMTKWVKALTMAALMQNFNDQPQKLSDRMVSKNEDGEEAGPTYANAPPKPRRSNDGYNSPSPDMYDPNYDLLKKPASHYSQGTNNTRYQDYPINLNQEPTYTCSPQSPQSPQSPPVQQQSQYQMKRSFDTHNLSLPLTNTITERLENNQYSSSSTYKSNPQSPYFDSRNKNQQLQQQPKLEAKSYKDQIYEQKMQRNPFLNDVQKSDSAFIKEADQQFKNNVPEQNRQGTVYNEIYPETRTDSTPNVSSVYNKDGYGDLNRPSRSGSTVNERLIERRTPDAYGRAASLSAYNKEKVEDYEDIYANENEYGKTYAKLPKEHQGRDNVSISSHKHALDQASNNTQEKTFSGPAVLRRKKMQASGIQPPMPRPHSADFLEYESKNEVLNKTVSPRAVCDQPRQPQRPKSSLDINSYYDPSSDRYYSEESYAEKMRQSAQYLQQQATGSRNIQVPLAKYASGLAEKQLNSAYSQMTNNNYDNELSMNRNSRDNVSYNSKYSDIEGLNSNWTLKEKETHKEYLNRSGSVMSDSSNVSGCVKGVNRFDSNVDGFMRSASARLPSTAIEKEGEKKIQQREESMKRLLEWKQRMLQSPLTRKSTPATISLARSLNHSRQSLRSDQYKSKTFTNVSYNSYSSDDEEETTGTDLQKPRNMQAGRSQKVNITSPIIMQPNTHAPFTAQSSENVLILNKDKNNENTYENILHPIINSTFVDEVIDDESSTENNNIVSDDKINKDDNDGYETSDSEAESETYVEYTDNDLDEVLLASDSDCKHPEDILLEECTKDDEVGKLIEQQSFEKSNTPPVRVLGEEHYLPMSPRKTSTLEPPHKTILQNLSVFDDTMPQMYEDNPYVEMNLGNEDEDMQTYEVVCVNNGKVEPVYMEVKNGNDEESDLENVILRDKSISDTVSNFADTKQQTLKRVSKGDKCKEKSDCSDADDEASREISLDTPFNRMSISDNFRPASYYLSESSAMLFSQNSTDNGVCVPPRVPSTSPPHEELSDEALSKYVLDKLDKSDIPQDSSILKMLTSENQNKINAKRKTTSLMIYGSRTSIHDTLTRGEKIRNSRASLANERQNIKEIPSFSNTNFKTEQNICYALDTDSLRSYNADRGSSRLSLDSDVSSKFDMTHWNISSDVTSLRSESPMNLTNGSGFREVDNMMKRRPLSDNSLFELNSSPLSQQNDSISHVDLDKYLENLQPFLNSSVCENSYENTYISDSNHSMHLLNEDDAIQTESINVKHTRCSSTPTINRKSNTCKDKVNIDVQYRNLEEHVSGYIGSQSSCSSVGIAKSPLSFYCKNNDEGTLLRKNLNKNSSENKIKEFQNVKLSPKSGNDDNTLSTVTGFHSRESSTEHSAPYYYSDLSSQEHINVLPTSHFLKNTNLHRKLNNQRRRGPLHKKNEISHIHNPIRNNQVLMSDRSFELASTARSVSVEFLSAADKDSDIDMKNIYESTGGKSSKIPESMNLISSLGCKRSSNHNSNDENQSTELCANHVPLNASSVQLSSTSMSSHCSGNSSNTVYYDAEAEASAYENILCQGEKHWDEDALWRDNLRRVSHRHARSMDDLDSVQIESVTNRSEIVACGMHSIKRLKKTTTNKINRNVTYVNCEIQRQKDHCSVGHFMHVKENKKADDNDVYVSLAENPEQSIAKADEGVYEQLTVGSLETPCLSQLVEQNTAVSHSSRKQFEIDREKLRQWDLMSSGLMKGRTGGAQCVVTGLPMGEVLTDTGTDSASNEASTIMPSTNLESPTNNNTVQQTLSKKSFLGSNTSIGRSSRDTNIPVRAVSPRVRWVEEKQSNDHYGSQQMSTSQQNLHTLNAGQDPWAIIRSPSRTLQQPISAVSPRVRRNIDNDDLHWEKQPTGQGELMGDNPTAGELLGRTHEELVLLLIQLRRRHSATHRSIEQCCAQISSIEDCLSSLKALEREESLQRLEQLKKQLMDLEHQYEKSKPLVQLVDNMVKLGSLYNRPGSTIERLERNQRLRQKVLAEHALEQQRWLESAAAGKSLETEAARARVAELWALEQELADEAAILQGLKTDKDTIDTLLTGVRSKLDSVPHGDFRVHANSGGLEAELTRVHAMLAHNSKKLEQTVADNARLERELQQLRRALQARRANAPAQAAHAHASHTAHPTALLENEVTRVQQLVSALQRQRQELSRAVRHLTQQSRALQTTHDSMPGKRRSTSSWQETNLDTGHTVEHGQSDYEYEAGGSLRAPGQCDRGPLSAPLYVDTRGPGADVASPLTSEDMQHNAFSNLSNVEKQEIKTVRIVKRESERRQRDRERSLQPMSDWPSTNITANLDQFLEEELVQPIHYPRASSLPRHDYNKYDEYYNKPQNADPNAYIRMSDKNMDLSPKYPSSPSLSNFDYSRDISSMSSSYNKSYDRSGYDRTISLSTQYLNSPTDSSRTLTNDPLSKTSSIMSLTRSNIELSPVFKSEAAKQIITEVSDGHKSGGSLHRRQVPKEKRRHYTAPHHLSAKTLNEMPKDVFNQDGSRSLDDADMERALRGAAPDVVRSALPSRRGPDSIDQLLAAPQKILIPERYIPEKPPELSPEEQQKRLEKVESIKKMLTDSSADAAKSPDGDEKRQREHLLQMNQILAKQVTEMSKIIAVRALEELPLHDNTDDFDDLSPEVELPIYQQRDNFFT